MDIVKIIRESEYTFPKQFSDQFMHKHYIINTSQDNPSSHDSNHAILIDIKNNTELFIKEIEEYYVERNMTPRFYPGWIENEIDTLFPIFKKNGYEIETDEIKMFLFQKTQPKVSNYTIFRAKDINKEISELIELEDGGDWNIRRINKLIINDDYHYLYIKDENQRIVAVAGLFISDKISRIDDVITHPNYRGKGYGNKLISSLIEYHYKISTNKIFLLAENPIAIKLYNKNGFIEIENNLKNWSAFKKL